MRTLRITTAPAWRASALQASETAARFRFSRERPALTLAQQFREKTTMTTATNPIAETYAIDHADRWLREITYARTLAYPHHERDLLTLALQTAYADGEAAGLESDCGHDTFLARDVVGLLARLGQRFSDDELGKFLLSEIEELYARCEIHIDAQRS